MDRDIGVLLPPPSIALLHGWSNALADETRFYRMVESVREAITGQEPGWKHERRLREEAMARKKLGKRPVNGCG